jgi:hypothetical protein
VFIRDTVFHSFYRDGYNESSAYVFCFHSECHCFMSLATVEESATSTPKVDGRPCKVLCVVFLVQMSPW